MSISIRNDDAAVRGWTFKNESDGMVNSRTDSGVRAWRNDGSCGGSRFLITATVNGDTVTLDKTYEEITAVIQNGVFPVCLVDLNNPEIIDLTGTGWYFNDIINGTLEKCDVTFNSLASSNSTGIRSYQRDPDTIVLSYYYAGDDEESMLTPYITGSGWASNGDKMIFITGGSQATDPTLINWLKANAVQQEPLAGTTWEFNNNIEFAEGTGFDLRFSSNSRDFNAMFSSSGDFYYLENPGEEEGLVYIPTQGWVDNAYKTVTFTGGADLANPQFIDWLKANATQQTTQSEQAKQFEFANTLCIIDAWGMDNNKYAIRGIIEGSEIVFRSDNTDGTLIGTFPE